MTAGIKRFLAGNKNKKKEVEFDGNNILVSLLNKTCHQ